MTKRREDYEVGYGKPPVHTRFKPGESGNSRGRPKGAGNFTKDLDRLLRAKVTVNQDGKPRKISTQEAALLRLGERALKGDPKALIQLLGLAQRRSEERDSLSAERHLATIEEDILARFEADIRKRAMLNSAAEAGSDHDDVIAGASCALSALAEGTSPEDLLTFVYRIDIAPGMLTLKLSAGSISERLAPTDEVQ